MPKKKHVTLHVVYSKEYRDCRVVRSDDLEECFDPEVERIDERKPLTVKLLAQWLDDEAEGENYHNFVGIHEHLGKSIAKHAGEDAAIKVLSEIVLAGSLRDL